jgi:hypothetical protein
MPKFYFNVFNDMVVIDDEGTDLPDVQAARAQARTGAAQMIAEQIIAGKRMNVRHRIEVEDEDRCPVFTLPFRDLVEGIGEGP